MRSNSNNNGLTLVEVSITVLLVSMLMSSFIQFIVAVHQHDVALSNRIINSQNEN